MKRFFDVIASLLGLVILSPVFLLCVLAVRISSKGPALHMSDRIGANNTHFNMIKFRTMRVDTPQVATHLMRNPNAYLSPVGKFLRRSSLDELPQLVNVLRGEMSIVGPRPALFNQDDLIALRTKFGCHMLVPGISGWAQVNGRDVIPITQKVELDTWYLNNRSFFLDIKIIFMTLWKVIHRKNVTH